ncbi:MAG: phosphotyrosine protein phosphatase [Nanoarchaeota archaeon]
MKVLFICNQNENRSKTAEELFKDVFETKSAGLYNEKPVTKKQLEWAEVIVVMEDAQRKEISKRFPDLYLKKRIISLDIPDIYRYDQDSLKSTLKSKIKALA